MPTQHEKGFAKIVNYSAHKAHKFSKLYLLLFIVIFGGLGTYLLWFGHAATTTITGASLAVCNPSPCTNGTTTSYNLPTPPNSPNPAIQNYEVYRPGGLAASPSNKVPAVLVFGGAGYACGAGSATGKMAGNIANTNRIIVVKVEIPCNRPAPDALNWIKQDVNSATPTVPSDEPAVTAIVNAITQCPSSGATSNQCVDPLRIYAEGASSGGNMAADIMCNTVNSPLFRGYEIDSSSLHIYNPAPNQPNCPSTNKNFFVMMALSNQSADASIYNGTAPLLSPQAFTTWVGNRLGCSGSYTTATIFQTTTTYSYSGCGFAVAGSRQVETLGIVNGGHTWFCQDSDATATPNSCTAIGTPQGLVNGLPLTHGLFVDQEFWNLVAAGTSSTASPPPTDTVPPSTSITAPSSGGSVSGTATITANASDNIGVVKVEFYVDGSLKSTATTSPYTYSWNTSTLSNGTHTLQTKAYDAAGNVGSSSTVSVSVNNTVVGGGGSALWNGDLQTGDLSQWHVQSCQNSFGNISVVANPLVNSVHAEKYAGLWTITDNATQANCPQLGSPTHPNGNLQSVSPGTFVNGDDRYIAFSTFFPSNFPTNVCPSGLQYNCFFQIAEVYGPPYGGSSPLGVDVIGNQIVITRDSTHNYDHIWTSPAIPYGTTWEDIVMHVHFATDNTGSLQLWLNGQPQTFSNGSTTINYAILANGINWNGSSPNVLYMAQYRSAPPPAGATNFSSYPTGTITLYHNEAKVGTTYNSVALGTSSTPPDTTPPTTSITAPASNATVSGTTAVAANAADNVGVANVNFYVDGVLKSTDTAAPYNYSWDTSSVTNGSHTLQTKAFDAAGNAGTSATVSVNVNNAVACTPNAATKPTAPTGLAKTSASYTSINLSWSVATPSPGCTISGYHIFRGGLLVGSTTSATYADTGLSAGKTYSYTIQAYDSGPNDSSQSAASSFTTTADNLAPTVPASVLASATSPGSVNLTWSASTDLPSPGGVGVKGYNIYRNGSQTPTFTVVGGSTVSFTDTTVAASTSYSYVVTALDNNANESAPGIITRVTTPAPTCSGNPSTPGSASATASTETTITLGWTASSASAGCSLGGYHLYRDGVFVTDVAAANSPSYTDSGLSPNSSYSYTLSAFDTNGHASALSGAATLASAPDTTPPSAPTTVAAVAASSGQVDLSWTPSTDNVGVNGYVIYRDNVVIATVDAATQNYSDTTVLSATNYSYQVSALDTSNNESTKTAALPDPVLTPTSTDNVAPSIPASLNAPVIASQSVSLAWTPSTDNVGVAGYHVYINGVFDGSTTTSGFTVSCLAPSTSYTFSVKAYDAAGNLSPAASLPVSSLSGGLAGDVNCDGTVDSSDLFTQLRNWHDTSELPVDGDINGDTTINDVDLFDLLRNWGK